MIGKHYQLIGHNSSKQIAFSVFFEDGSIRILQYSHLYACEFSADGEKLTFIFTGGAPMLTFTGKHLDRLADDLQKQTIASFFHYSQEDWDNSVKEGNPVILHVIEAKKQEVEE